jgi:hypothetical protein
MFANEHIAAIAEFGADPRERVAGGLFREIWTRVQGLRTYPYAPADKDPSTTFNGLGAAPQDFHGLTSPGGGLPYRNGGSAMLDTGLVEGPMGDPARRIFAQRLARRSAIGGM